MIALIIICKWVSAFEINANVDDDSDCGVARSWFMLLSVVAMPVREVV